MNGLEKRFPLYSKFINLYPAEYRKHYGVEILQIAADMLDDATNRSAKLAIDLPVNLTKQ